MKYIICNLKNSLNDDNISKYINEIKKIKYNNVIFCPNKKYINNFKDIKKVGSQDYYENIDSEYVIIGHYQTKDSYEIINEKLQKAMNKNKKVILCIGNTNYDDIDSIDKQINIYSKNIKSKNNIIIAYEPFFMIGSNKEINEEKIIRNIKYIKDKLNNIDVLYGGNVNENNIENLIEISDGLLIGRLSYDPHKLTNILNKLYKNT